MNVRISESDYETVRQLTSLSFQRHVKLRPETGCLLLVAVNPNEQNPSLVVNEILKPGAGDITETATDGLVFSASYLRRALFEVRQRGLAGILTLHTHPLAEDVVRFSEYDDYQDPFLMGNLYDLQPDGIFGSLVLGRNCIAGRLWPSSSTEPAALDRLIVVGERIQVFALFGDPLPTAQPTELFDRALALTGAGALAFLSKMRIGVIGTGGTGSLMIELLARAGAGEIVAFDFDVCEESNLNRVLHLRRSDVADRRLKADRLAEVVADSGLPTSLIVAPGGDIRNADVATTLAGCDFLVGCVDRDWPRLILCELAYQYLIPLIDLGTEIGVAEANIQSLDSRVSFVGPGRPCLLCSGVVSLDRIRVEGYGTEEQERVLNMGYSTDVRLNAPAVMDLNMRAASMAMLIIRHLLQPFLATPLAHAYRETVTSFHVRSLRFTPRAECAICGTTRLGTGCAHPLTTRHTIEGRTHADNSQADLTGAGTVL